MFILKTKYFLIIENIKEIDLSKIKKHDKFIIIYRTNTFKDKLNDLIIFRKKCNSKKIKFFVANDIRLSVLIKADGVYLSSYNHSFKALNLKNLNYEIIGSAHNLNEINLKMKQGCRYILLSKLFLVKYNSSSPYLGVIKYNRYLSQISKN